MQKLTLILLLFASVLQAQAPTFIHYTSGNKINDLAFDGQFIWIATQGGLVRYNKTTQNSEYYNRANSPLPINEIFSITIDAEGTKWLGTRIGLVRWKNNSAVVLNPSGSQLVVQHVRIDANGDVWMMVFGHNYNLRRFDGQAWYAYASDDIFGGATRMETSPSIAGVWVEGTDTLFRFDGTTLTPHVLPPDLVDPPGAGLIYDWALDANGEAWFISGNQLGVPAGNTWTLEHLDNYMDVMTISADGYVWMGSDFNGLIRRSPDGVYETVYNQFLPVYDFDIQLFAENGAETWMGTGAAGLKHFGGGAWTEIPVSVAAIPDHSVTQLEVTGTQTIWATFDDHFVMDWYNGGVMSQYNDQEWKRIENTEAGTPLFHCTDIEKDGLDRLWMTHYEQLYMFDGAWNQMPLPGVFPFHQVYSVCAEPATSNVWIGGYGKIARYDGVDFQVFDLPNPQMQVERIVVDQAGNVWVPNAGIDYDQLLWRFDGTQWTSMSNQDMGLSQFANYVRDLKVAPNGTLWVLTPWEITRFNGSTWDKLPLEVYDWGEFSRMAFDHSEKVWIGMYSVNCFGVNADLRLIKYENGSFTFYPYKTTPLPYPNITALAVDARHNVWIGCEAGGIAVFNENGIVLKAEEAPFNAALATARAFPNPAAENATIEYTISEPSDVLLEWYDATGQLIFRQLHKNRPAGTHQWTAPFVRLPQGIYYWKITAPRGTAAGSVVKS